MNINLNILEKTLHKSETGNISGEIFFKIDDDYFPEKNWNDFPVDILCWWIDSFIEFYTQKKDSVELYFMDGPFLVRCSLNNFNQLECDCLNRITNNVIYTFVINSNNLGNEIKITANQLIRFCNEKQFNTKEVNNLREKLKKLQTNLKSN